MEQLPISSRYRSRPDEPVSEDERTELNARLNTAYTDGSLAEDDYRARMDTLFAATTLGELVPVVQGLAPAPTHAQPAIVSQQGRPGELSESRRPGGMAVGVAAAVVAGGILVAVLLVLLLLL
ncbi:DUF1707 SHOCT-like domain-containing protein [Auraticoccus monumenti]|uniref:DUF1707 domain-containing protein n=1 Tax=Auraticoccus monumenti TaxID=675864 RepID=A0A1G6XAZ1_9ACTN|nr:DUF1707 domain-containing protein [Auraticoccus monumenti]SDD75262.1 protein of unknown function [Auraticoccus monumenti]